MTSDSDPQQNQPWLYLDKTTAKSHLFFAILSVIAIRIPLKFSLLVDVSQPLGEPS